MHERHLFPVSLVKKNETQMQRWGCCISRVVPVISVLEPVSISGESYFALLKYLMCFEKRAGFHMRDGRIVSKARKESYWHFFPLFTS